MTTQKNSDSGSEPSGFSPWLELLLVISSLVISLVIAEAYLRVSGRNPLYPPVSRTDPVLTNFREFDMMPSDIPELLYKPRPNVGEFNSLGFRGKEFKPEKSKPRILALGDSTTHGHFFINAKEAWPSQLEQILNNWGLSFEVINSGVVGYNIQQEYIFFKNFGLKLKPDLVILGLTLNDFEEKVLASSDQVSVEQIVVKERQLPLYLPARYGIGKWLFMHSHLYRFINEKMVHLFGQKAKWQVGKNKNIEALFNLKSLLDQFSIPVAAVIIPYTGYDFTHYPPEFLEIHSELKKILSQARIPHIDTLDVFKSHDVAGVRADLYCHYNAYGNLIIAQAITTKLLVGELLPGTIFIRAKRSLAGRKGQN